MVGYTFTYGVDGFGADEAPAYEEGVYLNRDKAFKHLVELNKDAIENNSGYYLYEEGYGEDFYPETDLELKTAEENEDWELYDKLIQKHVITDIEEICEIICKDYEEPPYGFYKMVTVNIY